MKPKKIKKSIVSFEKQRKKHLEKIKNYEGKNDGLVSYWKREINDFEKMINESWEKLKKKRRNL